MDTSPPKKFKSNLLHQTSQSWPQSVGEILSQNIFITLFILVQCIPPRISFAGNVKIIAQLHREWSRLDAILLLALLIY